LLTTWWVGNTYKGTGDIGSAFAGLIANVANPLLMCIPLLLFQKVKMKFGGTAGYVSLPAFWISFEFIHLRWDLTWPWLNLGNAFALFPQLFQWYEFTGALGGTLWLWVVNILLYLFLRIMIEGRGKGARLLAVSAATCIILPTVVSLLMYQLYTDRGKKAEVVLVQPNIDPYKMKFDPSTLDVQFYTLLDFSKQKATAETDFIVWPETALQGGFLVDELNESRRIQSLRKFLVEFPNTKLITGIDGYEKYESAATPTARYSEAGGFYFDAFNTAIQLDTSEHVAVYHKSKLVPGVEKMPYPALFKFLEPLALQMGGISGSLGEQKEREVFAGNDSILIGPEICYESVFGEYTAEYVRKGANLIFIITNDAWWGNTAGHKQHLHYARLRAVETRREVAQAANTGISAFINQRGEVTRQTEYWVPASISQNMLANSQITFYVRYGDYIGRFSLLLSVMCLIALTGLKLKEKFYSRKTGRHE
jgi:apolipoprotein N-acyltransferase